MSSVKRLLSVNLSELQETSDLKGTKPCYHSTSGIEKLDQVCLGFKPGDFVLVAGAISSGKTPLLYKFAIAAASELSDQSTLIYSPDVSTEVSRCLLSSASCIPKDRIQKNDLHDDCLRNIGTAISQLNDLNIHIKPMWDLTAAKIEDDIKIYKSEGIEINLVIIDDIQMISPLSTPEDQNDYVATSRLLKNIASKYNLAVIASSGLNRKHALRPNKRPWSDDIYFYSSAVNFANKIILLHRDEWWNPDTKEPNVLEIIIGKNSDGITTTIKVPFDSIVPGR